MRWALCLAQFFDRLLDIDDNGDADATDGNDLRHLFVHRSGTVENAWPKRYTDNPAAITTYHLSSTMLMSMRMCRPMPDDGIVIPRYLFGLRHAACRECTGPAPRERSDAVAFLDASSTTRHRL
jgi:hypothetical protein